MSSFKRKGSAAASTVRQLPAGTRASTTSPNVAYVSSGIASLDDVLGGGIPLGSVVVILAPDVHSSWGPLLQRYFIAQGLVLNQHVAVVADRDEATTLVNGCMWLPPSRDGNTGSTTASNIEDDEAAGAEEKIKIAWRYEKMQQFQTTVASSSSTSDGYCDSLDLTTRVPDSVVSSAKAADRLMTLDLSEPSTSAGAFQPAIEKIQRLVESHTLLSNKADAPREAVRLSIPDLGDPSWGDASSRDILSFLYRLRTLVRSTDIAALVTLPPHLSTEWPDFHPTSTSSSEKSAEHWHEKISFLVDGCLLFTSFGADPSLASLFRTYHGAVRVLRAPAIHTLLPASQKHSVLRGLRSSSSSATATASGSTSASSLRDNSAAPGTGENNLAFKCTRKRFVIETLHLDAEGGVGERRTSAPPSAHSGSAEAPHTHDEHGGHQHPHPHSHRPGPGGPAAAVVIESPSSSGQSNNANVSFGDGDGGGGTSVASEPQPQSKPRKSAMKKRVAFNADRPELYDF